MHKTVPIRHIQGHRFLNIVQVKAKLAVLVHGTIPNTDDEGGFRNVVIADGRIARPGLFCYSRLCFQLLDHLIATLLVPLKDVVEVFSVFTTLEQHSDDSILWGDFMVRVKGLHEDVKGADIAGSR